MASNCTKMVEVDKLFFADNVRTEECMAIPAIVESFRRHNYKANHPLVVSEKKGADGPTYLVLNGNRRGTGLVWLRDNDLETYGKVLPAGKVPAIVHRGLTVEEEVDLRIDHSSDEDRVALDEWSIFRAIKQLVLTHLDTQEHIAKKLGLYVKTGKQKGQPARSFVQVRVNLARLPNFIQDEVRKLTLDKDSTPIRWSDVAKLTKAYNAEYTTATMDGSGAELQKVWKAIMAPPELADEEEGGQAEPKELSPADAIKRSQSASSQALKRTLLVITRQSTDDLGEIDAQMLRAEGALQTLADVKEYMGAEEFASLVDAATKHCAAQRADEKATAEKATDENAIAEKVAEEVETVTA